MAGPTDIPLKVLTATCAADLLPLLGAPEAAVLGVESLELPATARAVDNVLRLQRPGGRPYLHLVEWQGYRDPLFLWRVLSYLAWLGLHRQERPIAVTAVYLNPAADMGDQLEQRVGAEVQWTARVRVVRLWEQDAAAAVAEGRVGLAVLSPLMGGATAALVEQAAAVVLRAAAEPRKADLLTILGVLAAPLVTVENFLTMLGRERLMSSDLISYLMADKIAEWDAERAELTGALAGSVQDAVQVRFPATPAALVEAVGTLRDTERLRALHHAVLLAPDQGAVEELLREATGSQ